MAQQNQPIGVILTEERYQELLAFEAKCSKGSVITVDTNVLNSVEQDLNKVPKTTKQAAEEVIRENYPKYTYEDKQYAVLANSQIKVRGILDKFMAHPVIGAALKTVDPKVLEEVGKKWLPVVVYKSLYHNPDGDIWTRMKEEFYGKFKEVK